MIREILTLVVEKVPTQYYIDFTKDRKQFNFQPSLTNKSAPCFTIVVKDGELIATEPIDPLILQQAKEKIKEILNNRIFDQF
jgi:hypothetical protein